MTYLLYNKLLNNCKNLFLEWHKENTVDLHQFKVGEIIVSFIFCFLWPIIKEPCKCLWCWLPLENMSALNLLLIVNPKIYYHRFCQSSPSLTILVSLQFIIISLVFFYPSKLLFWDFLQLKGNFVPRQKNSNTTFGLLFMSVMVWNILKDGANLFFNSSQFKFNIISSHCSWLFFLIKYDS